MAVHSDIIDDIYQEIFTDEKVCVFSCSHSPILVNGFECWKIDNIVYSDSIIDCFESYDSNNGQLLEPLTLPPIVSTSSTDLSLSIDDFLKDGKQQQSCQSNLSMKGSSSNKGKRKCSAPNCNPDQTTFFSFPNILQGGKINESSVERCRIWVKNCGNLSLLNKPSSKLFKQNFLCGKHFNDDQFTNKTKKRLKQDAIPTIFPNTVSLTDAQMITYPVLDSIIDCFESFDSSNGQLLKPLTLPSIVSTSSTDGAASNDDSRKHGKQHQSGQSNLSLKDAQMKTDPVLDSINYCCESYDSSNGQLLKPFTLPSIVSTSSTDHLASNDDFRKDGKQHQSCQSNLSRKGSSSNKGKRKCSAPNCNPDLTTFFSFPNILQGGKINESSMERCRIWIKNCGNLSLLNKPSSKLFKQNFLCGKHFNDDQFTNKTKKRLKQDAIPTIFPNTVSLTDAQMKTYPVIGPDLTEFYMFKHKQDDTTRNATLINDEIQIEREFHEEDMLNHNQDDTTNNIISNIDEIQRKFQEEMMSLEWRICPSCNAKFFCSKKIKKKCIYTKPVCRKNSLITLDDVPEELKNMTFIEEQLIAKIHPVVTVVKLKNHQLGYKGNVINFPQDVKEFASQLPHKISDLNNVLTIRASKDLKPVDFQVRADKVKKALEWLVANNKHYHNIEISTENLSLLPQNGNVFESVMGIDSFCDTESPDQNEPEYDSTEDIDNIFESGTPIMRQAAESDQIHSVINYPSIGSEPINEFNTDGYIAQAFPCLFPKGNGDFSTTKSKRESIISYFKHLMRYKDDRFAQHPRFRYFALNTYMRWSALRNGNVFVKKQPDLEDMNLENLKTRLQNDPGLLKKIMFQSSNIHGSKAYWFARGKELLAMVEQLGLPTLFFTLSAADLHWPDLFKLLAPDEDLQNITERRRRQLVRDNPLIVDTFFLHRAETFIEEVLKTKYKIKDLWYRIEYQHRGSPHIHGMLYIDGAPDVTNLINLPEEQQQIIIDYFNNLVTAFHPNIDQPPAEIHPSRKDLFSIADLDTDLAELLNRVQRHTQCSESYCLRRNKITNQLVCRFGFPQEYNAEAKIKIDGSKVEFVPQRNDDRLNKYNRYLIQTWRANIDVAPVLSKTALVNYLTKYISKCEQKSSQLSDLMSTINEASQQNKSVKHAIQKLYIKCCSERDFSAQETCHLLMGLKLYSAGGRTFISVNFNSQNEWRRLNSQNNTLSLIEKYQVRSERLEHKCLWEVAKMYSLPSETRHKKDAIVQVYPKYRKEVSQDNEKYYRQQVLLYLPWRDEATVMESCTTWKQVYEQNLEIISRNSGNICNFENETPDEDEIEEPNEQEFISTDEWMALSAMGPDQAMEEVDLGNREIDLSYDWLNNVKDYEQYGGIAGLSMYLQQMKEFYKQTEKESSSLDTDTNIALNEDQTKAMDLVKEQLQSLTSEHGKTLSDVPRRTIVQGRAGTGKSLLISKMTQLIKQTLGDRSYILLGPTGVSANNINGATIQSKLRIYKSTSEFTELRGTSLKSFQEEMENVEFVFIDEYSMVGCEMLHKIDQRLRQGKQNFHEEFGGLFVYLFGDINQLPPVLDVPVYSENQHSMEAISGKTLFGTFQRAIFLEQIHRQNNTKFQQILNNISAGNMLQEDYHVLETRFTTNVNITTRKDFENELHLFPEKQMVKNYNKNKLRCSKIPGTNSCQPVAKVPAKVSDKKNCHQQLLKNEALEETLYVSKGCTIMLRTNLWTDRGLVNGTTGEIVDILYHHDSTPQEDAPAVLLCKFHGYNGPFLDNESKIIPIIPIQKTVKDDNGRTLTMSQFPISVCYGCTIHKSQGLTLQKIFVNIGKRERQAGLTYVAISRVKSLEGLLLEPFPYARYFTIGRSSAIARRRAFEQHLREMSA